MRQLQLNLSKLNFNKLVHFIHEDFFLLIKVINLSNCFIKYLLSALNLFQMYYDEFHTLTM